MRECDRKRSELIRLAEGKEGERKRGCIKEFVTETGERERVVVCVRLFVCEMCIVVLREI